eukprot:23745-Chlamydomonas_euryale.AAC.1
MLSLALAAAVQAWPFPHFGCLHAPVNTLDAAVQAWPGPCLASSSAADAHAEMHGAACCSWKDKGGQGRRVYAGESMGEGGIAEGGAGRCVLCAAFG